MPARELNKNKGAFFCLEGIEGAGKSTLINNVSNLLNEHNLQTVITREPGGTELGKRIRELLLENTETNISPLSELLLFFADRVQHLNEVILPGIENGKIVLSDRFYYSTISYQCYGRGLERKVCDSLIEVSLDNFRANGVILIDLPVKVGLERAKNRATLDRFENEDLEFHERIRRGFLELASEDKERFLIIDGTVQKEEMAKLSLDFILSKIEDL